jgi:Ca2+-binding EF-hand superfamily protein
MIEDADEDGSGSINFPEFVGLMMKKQEGTISKEEIKQVPTTKKNSIECLFCFVL